MGRLGGDSRGACWGRGLLTAVSCPTRYDPRHNRWFQIQPLQQEHADLCVCVVGGYIYAVAGRDYHNDLTAVERYDPATNSWAYVAPLKREVRKPPEEPLPASQRGWRPGQGPRTRTRARLPPRAVP